MTNRNVSFPELILDLIPRINFLGTLFLTQKEWMTNTMKQPYTIKAKDFGNRLKTLNCCLALMPQDNKKDTVFTETNLKALLLKSMPSSWQNAYLLKGTQTTDNF